MRNSLLISFLAAVLLLLASCKGGGTAAAIDGEDTVAFHYATLLKMQRCEGYTVVEVRDPWHEGEVLHRYVLVPRDKDVPGDLPEGEVVRTPLSRSVVFTSVHCSLLDQLGAYKSIAGVCDLNYIYLQRLQQDVKAGKVADCGGGMNPNMEKIMDLSPDAVLISPFENSGSYGKLGTLGIPIIECADYMETSPLGRAEWMRFYGMLCGREKAADSIFAGVEKRYNELKGRVSSVKKRPTVVAEKKYGSSWYISGGNSIMGRLFADAGASYIFADDKSSGSSPYDPEVVFDRAQQAEFWLIKYNQAADLTYSQLGQEWGNYAQMAAYKNRNIFTANLSKVDFYEETPFHPDFLLKDLISIFHPEVMKGEPMRYYGKMSE